MKAQAWYDRIYKRAVYVYIQKQYTLRALSLLRYIIITLFVVSVQFNGRYSIENSPKRDAFGFRSNAVKKKRSFLNFEFRENFKQSFKRHSSRHPNQKKIVTSDRKRYS